MKAQSAVINSGSSQVIHYGDTGLSFSAAEVQCNHAAESIHEAKHGETDVQQYCDGSQGDSPPRSASASLREAVPSVWTCSNGPPPGYSTHSSVIYRSILAFSNPACTVPVASLTPREEETISSARRSKCGSESSVLSSVVPAPICGIQEPNVVHTRTEQVTHSLAGTLDCRSACSR